MNRFEDIPVGQIMEIPDPGLAAAIRDALGLAIDAPITQGALQGLTKLDAGLKWRERARARVRSRSITASFDLSLRSGLEHVQTLSTQPTSFNLSYNEKIRDVSPLAGSTQLQNLDLGHNEIADVSPLAGLTQLQNLDLSYNNIIDVSPLAELKQLQELHLSHNNIDDVSPLAKLTQLERLDLSNNNIVDVSPLANLTNLNWLHLRRNLITDASPLLTLRANGTKIRLT